MDLADCAMALAVNHGLAILLCLQLASVSMNIYEQVRFHLLQLGSGRLR
jgi:hypothetical protein